MFIVFSACPENALNSDRKAELAYSGLLLKYDPFYM